MNLTLLEQDLGTQPTAEDLVRYISKTLQFEALLNFAFRIISDGYSSDEQPTVEIAVVGFPDKITHLLNESPRKDQVLSFALKSSPVLAKVFEEKMRTYFRRQKDLPQDIIPSEFTSPKFEEYFRRFNYRDVAVLPLGTSVGKEPTYLLAVFGLLTRYQLGELARVVELFEHYIQKLDN